MQSSNVASAPSGYYPSQPLSAPPQPVAGTWVPVMSGDNLLQGSFQPNPSYGPAQITVIQPKQPPQQGVSLAQIVVLFAASALFGAGLGLLWPDRSSYARKKIATKIEPRPATARENARAMLRDQAQAVSKKPALEQAKKAKAVAKPAASEATAQAKPAARAAGKKWFIQRKPIVSVAGTSALATTAAVGYTYKDVLKAGALKLSGSAMDAGQSVKNKVSSLIGAKLGPDSVNVPQSVAGKVRPLMASGFTWLANHPYHAGTGAFVLIAAVAANRLLTGSIIPGRKGFVSETKVADEQAESNHQTESDHSNASSRSNSAVSITDSDYAEAKTKEPATLRNRFHGTPVVH